MRILLIRHGDPDYSIDSLTETGWLEAEALSDRIGIMKNGHLLATGTVQELKRMARTDDFESAFVSIVKEAAV